MQKVNKYSYVNVIQQYYSTYHKWEDASEYEANSKGLNLQMSGKFITTKTGRKIEQSLLKVDLKEYQVLGYPTRVIFRRVKN